MQTRKGELLYFNIILSNVIKQNKNLISTFFILIRVQSNNLNNKKMFQHQKNNLFIPNFLPANFKHWG